MSKILIHLTHGVESPTQADRAFLIAQTVIEEGHEVSLFLAGEAVKLLKDDILNTTLGYGPPLKVRYDSIVNGGGDFYLSKISCESRGVKEEDLQGKKVKLSSPNVLVQLSLDHDRVITYG